MSSSHMAITCASLTEENAGLRAELDKTKEQVTKLVTAFEANQAKSQAASNCGDSNNNNTTNLEVKLIEQQLEAKREAERKKAWSDLLSLRYSKGCPIRFVANFNWHVSRVEELGSPVVDEVKRYLFLNAVNAHHHAKPWVTAQYKLIETMPASALVGVRELQDEFVHHMHDFIGEDDGTTVVSAITNQQMHNSHGISKPTSVECGHCGHKGFIHWS
ncbi:hypothetical protein F4780DRAFT_730236 [Xylariomycetidae sp. FL0641]|nr:hypothetical protein F4780DRAFT_730236 [Xylariomycetidae sp. FL0641]